jgi:hypothetical protein
MAEINEAYAVLSDAGRRTAYDLERRREAASDEVVTSVLRNAARQPSLAVAPEESVAPEAEQSPTTPRRPTTRWLMPGLGAALVALIAVVNLLLPRPGTTPTADSALDPSGSTAMLQLNGGSGALLSSVLETGVARSGAQVRVRVRLANQSGAAVPIAPADFTMRGAEPPVPVSASDGLPSVLQPGDVAEGWFTFKAARADSVLWCPAAQAGACVRL